MRTSWTWVALLASAIAGCSPVADMRPGEGCGSCHTRPAPRGVWAGAAPEFGAAGTLYTDARASHGLAGATVDVVDRDGTKVSMTTSDVGNFYTTTRLTPPLHVSVTRDGRTVVAAQQMPSGDCNGCHTPTSSQGRVH